MFFSSVEIVSGSAGIIFEQIPIILWGSFFGLKIGRKKKEKKKKKASNLRKEFEFYSNNAECQTDSFNILYMSTFLS